MNGNVYITGEFQYTAIFGSTNIVSSGGIDIFVAKLDSNGTWIWAEQAGGSGTSIGKGISSDPNGNIYISGDFQNTACFGSINLNSGGWWDIFVAKLNTDGNWLWAKRAGGSDYGADYGWSICTDTESNVYMTGSFDNSANFGSIVLTSSGSNEGYVAKLDMNGNWLWVQQISGEGFNSGYGISTDSSGNILITGQFSSTASFGSIDLVSFGSNDIFVTKLDPSGAWLWAKKAGSISVDEGNGISTDINGNVYVTGILQNTADFGSIHLNNYGSGDVFVAKINSDNTLPVELSAFTAQFIENTPTLYWTTQSETDNMGWFVYCNVENNFNTSEKISEFIEGHGTTSQQQSYIFEDQIENPEVGDKYYYWLESIDYSGIINQYDRVAILTIPDYHDPGSGLVPVPEKYGLFQNEPNPVFSSTSIAFNLHESAKVEISIYNLKGELVRKIYRRIASEDRIIWKRNDENGKKVENGIYLYEMKVNGISKYNKKMLVIK